MRSNKNNSIDKALAGFCHNIKVVIQKDNSIMVGDGEAY